MKQPTEHSQRRRAILPVLSDAKADAFLFTALPNVRYLTGFTGSNGALILSADREILVTDPRYQTQAPLESDCEVKIAKGPLLLEIVKILKRLGVKTLAFERNHVSFDFHRTLAAELKKVRLKPVSGAVETLRMVKSEIEIASIRASVQVNSEALSQALEHFAPSMTEMDIAAEIDYRMRLLGADGTAFDTIVASGERSALPHARPAVNPIESNALLLIDMGATVAGYTSDMTRTFGVGTLKPKAKRLYRAVLESQLAAIQAIRPGVTCGTVDQAARKVLRSHKLDNLFIHSTGHGLGLEIHESPRLGKSDKTRLQAGMAVTVEPGVYWEGFGGVRIEDTVVVTANGCEVLTPTTKELVIL